MNKRFKTKPIRLQYIFDINIPKTDLEQIKAGGVEYFKKQTPD